MRTILFLAALTVFAAYTAVVAAVGVKVGRQREAAARQGINPRRYEELEQFVLDLTNESRQHELDPARMVVLPADIQGIAEELRRRIALDRASALSESRRTR